MLGGRYRLLSASDAAAQPIPHSLNLNYADLFKIQRISNPFPLRPVSFSRLVAYLECPSCALEQMRRRRAKEPTQFTDVHQASLFGSEKPDPRFIGTLLHTVIELLHTPHGPVEAEDQAVLLTSPGALARFLRRDLLSTLQAAGKIHLAMFFDQVRVHEETLQLTVLRPLVHYQRELQQTRSTVFGAAERFQLKLLSTGKTFPGHRDWGGYVGLVGEFDQIRLCDDGTPGGKPAIMEFKTGLGKKKQWDKTLEEARRSAGDIREPHRGSDELREPGLAHALQLMIYWLAFQTRWDILAQMGGVHGQITDLAMSLQQELDLVLYNLQDGCQYRLLPTDLQEALLAVTNCIFYVNWALKSGYAQQSPEHDCGKTQLLRDVPNPPIEVGSSAISAQQCYALGKAAFQRFSETVRWSTRPAEHAPSS